MTSMTAKNGFDSSSARTACLQAEVRQLHVQLAAARREHVAAQARTDSLEQKLKRATTQHQADLATKAAKIKSLERMCLTRDNRISRLLNTADVDATLTSALEAQCSSRQLRILELEAAVASLQQDRGRALELCKQHEDKSSRCEEALISLAACRMELQDLQTQCAALRNQLEAAAQVTPAQPPDSRVTALERHLEEMTACLQAEKDARIKLQMHQYCEQQRLERDALFICTCRQQGARCSICSTHDALVTDLQHVEDLLDEADSSPDDLWSEPSDGCWSVYSDDSTESSKRSSKRPSDAYSTSSSQVSTRPAGVPPIAWRAIKSYQQFAAEVIDQPRVPAIVAAVSRAAGYPDIAAASLAHHIVQVHSAIVRVHTAMQQVGTSPFARVSATSAVIQQHVQQALVSDGWSEQQAVGVATTATKMLFGMPGTDEVLARDPATFAVTAAVMAAQGPILDPRRMQQILHVVNQVACQPSCGAADMFVAVPVIAQLVVVDSA